MRSKTWRNAFWALVWAVLLIVNRDVLWIVLMSLAFLAFWIYFLVTEWGS